MVFSHLHGDHFDRQFDRVARRRFPEIDTAVVHLGATRVLFHTVTMDADQGVDFLDRVRPRQTVPVHFNDYSVFRSPLADFVMKARQAGHSEIRVVAPGERADLRSARRVWAPVGTSSP